MSATRPDDDLAIDPRTNAVTMGVVTVTPPPSVPASNRFAPGAIVAGRYRLVALLGRGGMGEVYRADDLTLDQTVALKFLPEGIAGGDMRLAQFHNELRTARQVSHRNVCRLYDLGDADGRRFLTMEYVDGEDLASLLRRIGRIPQDKAIQIARQLCAGVAAAHDRGVLHRDLKPANVMVDGHGDVRITDFGIATAARDAGADIAGTPHYMAPEQLAGRPASIRSDLYALGLILFEIFTGKRAYEATSLGELKQLHDTGTVTAPSSIVRDLDPAVERVILRCLEKDPERRPASALTVAVSLPGGDPLAAALAAGETPSPELLVAAGESQAMPVAPALAMTAAFLVALLLSVVAMSRGSVVGLVPMAIPRDALADRAEQFLGKLGYSNDIVDRAMGFQFAQDYLRWEQRNGPADWWTRLRAGRPPAMIFWYRTSPRELPPPSPADRVNAAEPPMNVSGMHQLFLDTEGRLVEFQSVPPQVATEGAAPAPPWQMVFESADLDPKALTATAPQWIPRSFTKATTE
jgi:serine/threonine-protein kinase